MWNKMLGFAGRRITKMKKMNSIVLIALVLVLSLNGCDTKNQIKPTNYPSPTAQVTPATSVMPTAASPSATQSQRFSVYSVENSTKMIDPRGSGTPNISFNGTPGYSLSPDQRHLLAIVKDFINEYFQFRKESFYVFYQNGSRSPRKVAIADNSAPAIISDEEERQVRLTQATEKLNEIWWSTGVVSAITELKVEGNTISAHVYEAIHIPNDSVKRSPIIYGVEHDLVFSNENGSIILNEDNYDEGPPVNMRSSTFSPVNNGDQMTPDQVIHSWLEALRKGDTYTYWSLCSSQYLMFWGGAQRIFPHQLSNISIELDNSRTNNNVEANYIVAFDLDETSDGTFKTGKYHELIKLAFKTNAWKIDAKNT